MENELVTLNFVSAPLDAKDVQLSPRKHPELAGRFDVTEDQWADSFSAAWH
jgi:hypothetical protein